MFSPSAALMAAYRNEDWERSKDNLKLGSLLFRCHQTQYWTGAQTAKALVICKYSPVTKR